MKTYNKNSSKMIQCTNCLMELQEIFVNEKGECVFCALYKKKWLNMDFNRTKKEFENQIAFPSNSCFTILHVFLLLEGAKHSKALLNGPTPGETAFRLRPLPGHPVSNSATIPPLHSSPFFPCEE